MAELSDEPTPEPAADSCCAATVQLTCCAPSAKADCCGRESGCGCDAGEASPDLADQKPPRSCA